MLKRKILSILLIIAALVTLIGCGDTKPEYSMKNVEFGKISMLVPNHFELVYEGEGECSYSTLSASISLYHYSELEIMTGFPDFMGELTAQSFAEYIVDTEKYNCEIEKNADGTRASYTFYHTDNSGNYFRFTNLIIKGERELYMVTFSVYADKVDYYSDMFKEAFDSVTLNK